MDNKNSSNRRHRWRYLLPNCQQSAPVTFEQFQQLFDAGTLTKSSWVWHYNYTNNTWKQMSELTQVWDDLEHKRYQSSPYQRGMEGEQNKKEDSNEDIEHRTQSMESDVRSEGKMSNKSKSDNDKKQVNKGHSNNEGPLQTEEGISPDCDQEHVSTNNQEVVGENVNYTSTSELQQSWSNNGKVKNAHASSLDNLKKGQIVLVRDTKQDRVVEGIFYCYDHLKHKKQIRLIFQSGHAEWMGINDPRIVKFLIFFFLGY
ncbi:hypothetical protein RFI_32479 [Reticulomyxa filosa]|uniref:Uncharacterized protein n=1 Tax=Reticulomyxa filosa TaxID=46433 RepID=X6LU89_RETFI|nr:hypothetical protein RFI_32479 [Reticulomyxa filosa]|eukprot:ETO04916.1 hypothetical protein RFI_32479 [Reticulomyxa filosa]